MSLYVHIFLETLLQLFNSFHCHAGIDLWYQQGNVPVGMTVTESSTDPQPPPLVLQHLIQPCLHIICFRNSRIVWSDCQLVVLFVRSKLLFIGQHQVLAVIRLHS